MREWPSDQRDVLRFPQPFTDVPADKNVASVIDLLQEHLVLAREGKLRSISVVSVSADRDNSNRHPLVVYPWGQRKSHRQADGVDP